MTPKEELLYRIIVKHGPITQNDTMRLAQGKVNRNDYSLFGDLQAKGFIKKETCRHCNRDGVYVVKKKIKPSSMRCSQPSRR